MTKVAIRDVLSNPFRELHQYPLNEDKITRLIASIEQTGFWDNLFGRPSPTQPGKVEIAYGHHRLEALRRKFKPTYKIDIPIRDLTNEIMLQMMANENAEEYGASALTMVETIEAVIKAYGKGEINVPREVVYDSQARRARYAPSFVLVPIGKEVQLPQGADPNKLYTARSLATFLGWTKPNGEALDRVQYVLQALSLMEDGFLTREEISGYTPTGMKFLVRKLNRQRERYEHTLHVAGAHEALAGRAQHEAEAAETPEERERAKRAAAFERRLAQATTQGMSKRKLLDITDFTAKLSARLTSVLDDELDSRVTDLREVLKHIEYVDPVVRADLARTLLLVATRATNLAEEIQQQVLPPPTRLELVATTRK